MAAFRRRRACRAPRSASSRAPPGSGPRRGPPLPSSRGGLLVTSYTTPVDPSHLVDDAVRGATEEGYVEEKEVGGHAVDRGRSA